MSVVPATHFIDGRDYAEATTSPYLLVNPATEDVVTEALQGSEKDVATAVDAAAKAQTLWRDLAPTAQGELLRVWADLIEEEGAALGQLDTLTVGRPLRDTQHDAAGVAGIVRYWAGITDKLRASQLPIAPGHLVYTSREPLGVVGILLPWNGPAAGFVERVAPALACGNAVVVKPSELAPLSALRLAHLSIEAGLPNGLINVVTGDGVTGEFLTRHADVAGISFTGSVGAGRQVNLAAAERFTKVVLELGGKSPNIVFADADINAALRGTTWGIFFNSGQVCCAGTRLLVERSISDTFVEALVEQARGINIGDPLDLSTHMGPVASKAQFERVNEYLEVAHAEGARRANSSGNSSLPDRGYFVEPAIFCDVDPHGRLASEEVFGPVLSVIPFDSPDEAISIANDSPYGLSANIWTKDLERMLKLSEKLHVGSVWGNTKQLYHPAMPFGGYKASGVGNAGGDEAIEANTQVKVVAVRYSEDAPTPGWDDVDGRLPPA